jgi:hypothetical protein
METASAMTGLEFLQSMNASGSDYRWVTAMQKLEVRFLADGYEHIPAWDNLAYRTKELILKNGYAGRDVEEIAKEAAIASGMVRKQ